MLGEAPVLIAGSEEQKQPWLAPLVDEPLLTSFGLTEPDAGSDVARIRPRPARDGDEYVLNGRKMFITNGGVAEWHGRSPSTDRSKPQGHHVPSSSTRDANGVTVGKHVTRWASARPTRGPSRFDDVIIPAADRLGEEGEGFKIAMKTLDSTRPGTAAGAVGVARAALRARGRATRKERQTFGKPIASTRPSTSCIADMATEIEAARLLTCQAAWLLDTGSARRSSLFAKRFSADTAMKVTTDAVQVFGGYGYIKEYPVEKLMRDAKLFQIYEGTSQIQRLVIAKELFLPRDG